MSKLDKIIKSNICIGCGLCEGIDDSGSIKMEIMPDGFFKPRYKTISQKLDQQILKVCPAVHLDNHLKFGIKNRVWGRINGIFSGSSNNSRIKEQSSSGGAITSIAISLIKNSYVDSILQVGSCEEDITKNELKINKSEEDIISCASSRYAPSKVFNKIIQILEGNQDTYCFIGKPCDISAIKNLLKVYPEHQGRIKLFIAIFCAGVPSFKGTNKLISQFSPSLPISKLKYRGDGWPGYFSFQDNTKKKFRLTYNESWGKVLNKHLNFRCKICPDGIGIEADIAIGDAWETEDGYPDFEEKEGRSLIVTRTERGKMVISQCVENNAISISQEYSGHSILRKMQPYQYYRRKIVGARIFAFFLFHGRLLKFRSFKIIPNLLFNNPINLINEFTGSFRRVKSSSSINKTSA